jgi:hypothetical protein
LVVDGAKVKIKDGVDLSRKLASTAAASQCLSQQIFRLASSRQERLADACVLERVSKASTIVDMFLAVVTSPEFKLRAK